MTIKRIAFFVEGHTEAEFLEATIKAYAEKNSLAIHKASRLGSDRIAYQIAPEVNEKTKYYVLIVNCMQDDRVKSLIKEHVEKLHKNQYSLVVGIHDVYPKNKERVLINLSKYLPTKYMEIRMIAGVMEVESWFIQNKGHYSKIDPSLDYRDIEKIFGIDIEKSTDVEDIPHPAGLLNSIYNTCGKSYNKSKSSRGAVIDALDYEEMFCDKENKSEWHNKFIEAIESAFN